VLRSSHSRPGILKEVDQLILKPTFEGLRKEGMRSFYLDDEQNHARGSLEGHG
jgi:hypothetical protein